MSDLINRLRGIYTIPVNDGAGLLDGKDTFTRKFDNLPPIFSEAADALEANDARVEELEAENERLRCAVCQSLGNACAKHYQEKAHE